jgi:predicted ATPase
MVPRIRTVQIKNYKSLADVSVELEPFTVFVGHNGSGKSNFIDAIAFVQESLSESVEIAFKRRGGIAETMSRVADSFTPGGLAKENAQRMGFRLWAELEGGISADYAFEIEPKGWNGFIISRENCVLKGPSGEVNEFEIHEGRFTKPVAQMNPAILGDRLALPLISGAEDFRPLWDFLYSMRMYSIEPSKIREFQVPDAGYVLNRDGSNVASVLKNLKRWSPRRFDYDRLVRLLSEVAAGIEWVHDRPVGTRETVLFKQDIGLGEPTFFDALNMSDGTLRVLGLLLAVGQPTPSVVGIEEPEATVHPAIIEMIMEVLLDASNDKQVLITTHSPEVLDYKELKENSIRVVVLKNGRSSIAPASETDKKIIREHLYSPGELLRIGELNPAEEPASADGESRDLSAQSPSHAGDDL